MIVLIAHESTVHVCAVPFQAGCLYLCYEKPEEFEGCVKTDTLALRFLTNRNCPVRVPDDPGTTSGPLGTTPAQIRKSMK